jgi:hypothetical protein
MVNLYIDFVNVFTTNHLKATKFLHIILYKKSNVTVWWKLWNYAVYVTVVSDCQALTHCMSVSYLVHH